MKVLDKMFDELLNRKMTTPLQRCVFIVQFSIIFILMLIIGVIDFFILIFMVIIGWLPYYIITGKNFHKELLIAHWEGEIDD